MPPLSIDTHPSTEYNSEPVVSETSGHTIVQVTSDNITYNHDHILSKYIYENAIVSKEAGKLVVKPTKTLYEFKTETNVPRVGYRPYPDAPNMQSYDGWLGRQQWKYFDCNNHGKSQQDQFSYKRRHS